MKYNIDFEIAALALLLLYYIYFRSQYDLKAKNNRYFRYMVFSLVVTTSLDMITAYTISYAYRVPIILNIILNPMFFMASVSSSFLLCEYMRLVVAKKDKRDLLDKVVLGIYVTFIVICATNPFTKLLIYFDESRAYCHGPLYYGIYALPLLFMLVAMGKVISVRHEMERNKYISAFSCVLITTLGAFLQLVLFGNTLAAYFASAMAIMALLQTFETPDYEKLVKRTEELKDSQELLEAARSKSDEQAKTIHRMMKTAYWSIEYDKDGNYVNADWSPEFFHMLGYDESDFADEQQKNLLWRNSIHPDDAESTLLAFDSGTKGFPYNKEHRLADKFGTYRWYVANGTPKYDSEGRLLSYQGIIRDIDDDKYRDSLIHDRLQALYELGKSQDKLKKALFAAEEASRAKTAFLSSMSHDIRTPMNAIIGFTELALEHVDNPVEVTDCLNTIKMSGEHLLSLINDVLDMSRIESGKIQVEPKENDLRLLLDDLRGILKTNITERNQKYVEDYSGIVHSEVMCDRLRLNQILLNCLGNSVKFTPDGGTIGISVRELELDAEGTAVYEFRIKDSGIGMNAEFLARIFEPFEREKSSTIDKTQGSGLGMAITKNLVNMMNGTIEVKSEQNVGTEFIIMIPFKTIGSMPARDEVISEDENGTVDVPFDEMVAFLKGRNFLVVDDNAVNRKIVIKLLANLGLNVDEADGGQKAIDILAKNPDKPVYELVFMDIMMPGMNGYETTDKVRTISKQVAAIPIIAMTANAFEEDRRLALEHGMVEHVAKPFKLEELVSTLYRVLSPSK